MASTHAHPGHSSDSIIAMNSAPAAFDPAHDLPQGFIDSLLPLHRQVTPQEDLRAEAEQFTVARVMTEDLIVRDEFDPM